MRHIRQLFLVGLMFAAGCGKGPGIYTVTVNYDTPVAELVTVAAYRGYRDPNITDANFPTERSGTAEVTIELVEFDHTSSTVQVRAGLKRRSLRPATLRELLALGAQDPKLGLESPVVALGSEWAFSDGGLRAPCVDGGSWYSRRLYLDWIGNVWGSRYWFAAVRE